MDDFDDDLPPPPPKPRAVVLDDSDDDLPPPPAKKPVEVDLDEVDVDVTVQPPQPSSSTRAPPVGVPDDFDDDLPPPSAAAAATASLPADADGSAAAAAAGAPSLPAAVAAGGASSPLSRPRSSVTILEAATPPSDTMSGSVSNASLASNSGTAAVVVGRSRASTVLKQKLFKEGNLMKQQPNWPYTTQKRWCVVANRQLSYYESKENMVKASGTLDLKDAQLKTSDIGTDRPFSFGIQVQIDPHGAASGGGSGGGGRTYVFSALNKEDFVEWTAVLSQVCSNNKAASDLHWFEKIAQGTF